MPLFEQNWLKDIKPGFQFCQVYHLGVTGVRKLACPVAFAMRKGVNMHPSLQQSIAQIAKKSKKEEKEVIEIAARRLVFHTIALSSLVYFSMESSRKDMERMQKKRQELDELLQELHEKQQKLPPELVELHAVQQKYMRPELVRKQKE